MKKLFLLVVIGIVHCTLVLASTGDNEEPVILTIKKGEVNEGGSEPPRAPMRVPSLYIEDHTLSFSSACVGYTLELIQDGETVYSFCISDTDDLVLPDYLCGQFEIRLVGTSFTFVGEIEL